MRFAEKSALFLARRLPRSGLEAVLNRRSCYPLYAALLALGAPAGLLVLRATLARALPGPAWLLGEVRGDLATYLYVTLSTTTVFVYLGWLLGKRTDQLLASSGTDVLTGLANRRRFDTRLENELQRVARHAAPLSLLLVDVDGLKKINDVGGHEAGDAALRAVGDALRATCRRTDLAARVGGDEFAILAPQTTAAAAMEVASRLRANLAKLPPARRAPTVSVGVADARAAGSTRASDLLATADRALYQAKTTGRDRAVLAEPC